MDGINILTYNAKAILIQVILLVIGGIIAIKLNSFLELNGFKNVIPFCTFIPLTILGIYIIFGKYVYIRGGVITGTIRLVYGLSLILIPPLILLITLMIKS